MASKGWDRAGAAGGVVFVILQLTAQILIQLGAQEPAFSAPGEEILAFFMAKDPGLFAIADFLGALSLIALLWYLGVLWRQLRVAEGVNGWGSTVALGSGLLMVATSAAASGWPLAVFRVGEGLDPQLARYLFDEGNYAFATLWVFAASLLLASALVVLRKGGLPRWQAWFGAAVALGLLVVRPFWASSELVFLPYTLFWVWLIASSIALLRAPGGSA